MDITCPACQARFSLRADRIPKTAFRVACGKCKHQFVVDPAELGNGAAASLVPMPPPSGAPAAPSAPQGPVESAPAAPLGRLPGNHEVQAAPVEEYHEGLRLALVCDTDPERQETVCKALRELGYKPHVAPRPREALAWLYQHRYELMLVHEEFGGGPPEQNAVVLGLAALPMAQRRQVCVGLCGKTLRTMDNMAAFCRSVHFVVNERDLGRLRSIARTAVADNDQFYRVFREVMRQIGRA